MAPLQASSAAMSGRGSFADQPHRGSWSSMRSDPSSAAMSMLPRYRNPLGLPRGYEEITALVMLQLRYITCTLRLGK